MKEQKEGKDNRTYNVFFNLHTVSGIVISIGLFVCFFAGAFALFQDEIDHWETNRDAHSYQLDLDYEKIMGRIKEKGYQLENRNISISLRHHAQPTIYVFAQPVPITQKTSPSDSTAKAAISMKIAPESYQVLPGSARDKKETLGAFLYRLHFFDQIPALGIYLAGFVALFFLFAILSGIIIHWKKIFKNFFTFRIHTSLKNLWTDGHTALGVIGLPFQFMYAVTGAFYGLSIVILVPAMMVLFDGNQNKAIGTVFPAFKAYDKSEIAQEQRRNLNELRDGFLTTINGLEIETINAIIGNYGDQNAYITFDAYAKNTGTFYATAYTTYRLMDGSILTQKKINENSYKSSTYNTFTKLHYAQYGGYFVKGLYFIMALVTCFVIISGVMIWLVARDKKSYEAKKKFNTTVGGIYLGICLGLFPAVAFLFNCIKALPHSEQGNTAYSLFGIFWLIFTGYSIGVKSPRKIMRSSLVLGGVLGVSLPFTNGLTTGYWFWNSWSMHLLDSFYIDLFWLVTGIISLTIVYKNKFTKTHKIKFNEQSI